MRSDIDGLMAGGLGDWLAGQNAMRAHARKQAESRWIWSAVLLLPALSFLWFSPASPRLASGISLVAIMCAGLWGYAPITAAKRAIKIGINSAIAAAHGLNYSPEVTPGPEFAAARTYGLVPGFERSGFEDRWHGTLEGHDFELYEAHLEDQRGSGKNRRWVTVFRGPVIRMAFGRRFRSTTLLERAGKHRKWMGLGGASDHVSLMATGSTGSIRSTPPLPRVSAFIRTTRSRRACWCIPPMSSNCSGSKTRSRRANCARCS